MKKCSDSEKLGMALSLAVVAGCVPTCIMAQENAENNGEPMVSNQVEQTVDTVDTVDEVEPTPVVEETNEEVEEESVPQTVEVKTEANYNVKEEEILGNSNEEELDEEVETVEEPANVKESISSYNVAIPTEESEDLSIDEINFPDKNFREYVKKFDSDNDGKLTKKELDSIKHIDCSYRNISD